MSAVEVFKFTDAEKTFVPDRCPCAFGSAYPQLAAPPGKSGRRPRAVVDVRIGELIHQIHVGSRGTYEAPTPSSPMSMVSAVAANNVARLMRIAKLGGVCRRRVKSAQTTAA